MCGCSATTNGHCVNCNPSSFLGYDNPGNFLANPLPIKFPNTNGANCSTSTEYIDVSKINLS